MDHKTRWNDGMSHRRPYISVIATVLIMHGRGLIMWIISFCSALFAPPPYTISLKRFTSAYISYTARALGLDLRRVASKCSLCIKK